MLHKPAVAPAITESFRETRDFAFEVKFLLSARQAQSIGDWARAHLQADTHGSGEHGDAYQVSSIYYDSEEFAVYRRIGSYGRSKFRVRRYNDSDHVFLERKTKTETQVSKRRSLLPIEALSHLALPLQPTWSGYWFQRRLRLRALLPVCRIQYQRMARVGQTETGPCRLTLDHALRAEVCSEAALFTPYTSSTRTAQLLLADKTYILELKYRYALPSLFRQLLVEFAPVPQRVSKYRLAVQQLALVDAQAMEPSTSEYDDEVSN
jgi:hypothetical protein